jgi:hypothetical protein
VIVTTCPPIVAVPVRDGPLVGATVTVTEAGPDPDAGPTEIQSALLEAVHGHPAPEVIATARVPPAASSEYVVGVTVYVHPSDCVTLKCCPAIMRVPARGGPVVGATVKVTVAEPFPFAFELTEIQSTSDAAVHVQSGLDARTSTVPVPPLWGSPVALLDSSSRHSPAACATCARCPFIITPPERDAGSAFAAALN